MKNLLSFFVLFFAINLAQTSHAYFEKMADIAGFNYNQEQDIYISKVDANQRFFGYNDLFDFLALPGNMILDAEPIIFNHNGKDYMIELWKGQYFAASGAEIGFYESNGFSWNAVRNNDMLYMSFSLKRHGKKLFERNGYHWWLTGFEPGVFSNTEDLSMENIFIEFKDLTMRNAFLTSLYELGYQKKQDKIYAPKNKPIIIFNYKEPKTPQKWTPESRQHWQEHNLRAVEKYNMKRKQKSVKDNSPVSIDKLIFE